VFIVVSGNVWIQPRKMDCSSRGWEKQKQ